ncbi:hypothetical protein [Spiroplasma endosymbiont of Clivina fossor]|uniref:hypothetical protein n=1 Tax=Spiroplasma endosymbiont of Clivina fossor TaxID=3066282 RepID=UPI00313C4F3C
MIINLKEFDWEQIKQTFWDLFIQITTIPAHITGGKEIKLTEVPLLTFNSKHCFLILNSDYGVIYSNATLKNNIGI